MEGCVGRVFGVFFNFSVLVGWVMCEDGGFYQCRIIYMGVNNELLIVMFVFVNVVVVGKI